MALTTFYTNNDGDIVEANDLVPADEFEVVIHASEATIGTSTVTLEDDAGDFNVRGHRLVYFREMEAADDAFLGIIGPFFTNHRVFTRGTSRVADGRTVRVELVDINTLLSRRVQKGTDAQRPAENDTTRLNWLIDTAEFTGGYEVEVTTHLYSDAPVAMSETDYRGVDAAQVVNDLLQQSGGNCYLYNAPTSGQHVRVAIWYGRTERTEFASIHKISNVLADVSAEVRRNFAGDTIAHDTPYVFPPSQDAELDRDPSRVYSGAYVNWDGGYSYTQREATAEDYARRDGVFQAELVKTKAAGDARSRRYTRDLRDEDDQITCAVIVPSKLVHAWVPGHRVQVKFSHLPGYEDYVWMRVASVTYRQLAKDSELYELGLDLRGESPPETGEEGASAETVFAVLNRPGMANDAGGALLWASSGDNPKPGWPSRPTQGLLSIVEDLTPVRLPWRFEGIQVDGDGTLDLVRFRALTAGVTFGAVHTITWNILKNGIVVASVSKATPAGDALGGFNGAEVSVTNLSVANGDVISASVGFDPPIRYGRVPSGTGSLDEELVIVGGTLA